MTSVTPEAPKEETPKEEKLPETKAISKEVQTAVILTVNTFLGRQGDYVYTDKNTAQGLIDSKFAKKPTKELLKKLGYEVEGKDLPSPDEAKKIVVL